MIIKVQYEQDGYVYEIPLSKLLPVLTGLTEQEIEQACKKAIMRI